MRIMKTKARGQRAGTRIKERGVGKREIMRLGTLVLFEKYFILLLFSISELHTR